MAETSRYLAVADWLSVRSSVQAQANGGRRRLPGHDTDSSRRRNRRLPGQRTAPGRPSGKRRSRPSPRVDVGRLRTRSLSVNSRRSADDRSDEARSQDRSLSAGPTRRWPGEPRRSTTVMLCRPIRARPGHHCWTSGSPKSEKSSWSLRCELQSGPSRMAPSPGFTDKRALLAYIGRHASQ